MAGPGMETPNEQMVVFSNTVTAGFDALSGSVNGVFGLLIALVVALTGIAELLGAAALVQPVSLTLRRAGAIGLAAYAVCVFPANIHHFALDMARADGGFGLGYHIPRMIAQPILVWLALWTGGVTDWPLHRR